MLFIRSHTPLGHFAGDCDDVLWNQHCALFCLFVFPPKVKAGAPASVVWLLFPFGLCLCHNSCRHHRYVNNLHPDSIRKACFLSCGWNPQVQAIHLTVGFCLTEVHIRLHSWSHLDKCTYLLTWCWLMQQNGTMAPYWPMLTGCMGQRSQCLQSPTFS